MLVGGEKSLPLLRNAQKRMMQLGPEESKHFPDQTRSLTSEYPCHEAFEPGQPEKANLKGRKRLLEVSTHNLVVTGLCFAVTLPCKNPLQTTPELQGQQIGFITAEMTGLFILAPCASLLPLLL